MIRKVCIEDAPALCAIYNYYVEKTTITFEEEPLTVSEMQNRIKTVTAKYPWLVYCKDSCVSGFAYACQWKSRSAYKFSVESAIYLDKTITGKGIGKKLYPELLRLLRAQNIHAVIGGIAIPNDASIALHEKYGFKQIGHFKEVGYKFSKWIDVGYWQLILN